MNRTGSIVVLGAEGMLGRAWRQFLDEQAIPARFCDLPKFDLTDPATYAPALDAAGCVINCAAYTDVDGAETDPTTAQAVNDLAVGRLAEYCRDRAITLLHYSTDYVFDGRADVPWPIDARRRPINVYGRTKAAGEQRIERIKPDYLLIRTSWLYAPWGHHFVRTMARLTAERDTLSVVNDQHGRPTSALPLVRASWVLLERGVRGIAHVCDGGQCTWFELACRINDLLGRTCAIEPCTTAEFPRPAPRPLYSTLDLAETERLLGPMTPWWENLAEVLEHLEPIE